MHAFQLPVMYLFIDVVIAQWVCMMEVSHALVLTSVLGRTGIKRNINLPHSPHRSTGTCFHTQRFGNRC